MLMQMGRPVGADVKADRSSAEGFSSLMADFSGAFGLTLMTLRYEYIVIAKLTGEFGESNQTQTVGVTHRKDLIAIG